MPRNDSTIVPTSLARPRLAASLLGVVGALASISAAAQAAPPAAAKPAAGMTTPAAPGQDGQASDGAASTAAKPADAKAPAETKPTDAAASAAGGTEGRAEAARQDAARQPDSRQVQENDREAFFNAHLAAIHAGLGLSAEQDGLWTPVEAAIRGFEKTRHPRRTREEIGQLLDQSPNELLQMRGEQLSRRGEAMRRLATATKPLLDQLDDGQRRRLPFLLDGMQPGPVLRAAFDLRNGRIDDPDARDARRDGRDGSGRDDDEQGSRGQDDGAGRGMRYDERMGERGARDGGRMGDGGRRRSFSGAMPGPRERFGMGPGMGPGMSTDMGDRAD